MLVSNSQQKEAVTVSLFNELKRRNVFRVAIAYLAVSWLLIQIVETIFPLFGLSDALIRLVIILSAIGFPLVVVFSWIFELTPDGLKLDKNVDHSSEQAHHTGKKFDRAIIIVLALSLGYFAFDKFVLDPARDAAREEVVVQQARTKALKDSFGDRSIAVLPFANMSDEVENEYFSDGISEELLNLLAKIPRLRVISRSSSFTYKGNDVDIPTIAEQLNVAHVLEGSVRKSGNRIRITAQLIEARSDTHLWSETYDRDLDDVFAVQDEISAAIVEELAVNLGVDIADAPSAIVVSNDAHEAFLRGRFLFNQRTRESTELAISEFEKAVSLEPNYANAQAELALATLILTRYQDGSNSQRRAPAEIRAEAVTSAQPHVSRALALDPTLAEANAAAAWLAMFRNEPDDVYLGYFENAVKFNPNYSDGYNWLGAFSEGATPPRYKRLLVGTEKAAQLDPLSQRALHNYARILIMMNRLDEADVVIEKLAVISRHHYLSMLAFRNEIGGNWSAQIFGMLDIRMLDPEGKGGRGTLRFHLRNIGLIDEAIALTGPPNPWSLAWAGRIEDAIELAETRLAEDPDSELLQVSLRDLQEYAGIYTPEGFEVWEADWQEGPDSFDINDLAMLVDIRRHFGRDDVSHSILAMKAIAQNEYDGGIISQGSPDYKVGLA